MKGFLVHVIAYEHAEQTNMPRIEIDHTSYDDLVQKSMYGTLAPEALYFHRGVNLITITAYNYSTITPCETIYAMLAMTGHPGMGSRFIEELQLIDARLALLT